MSGSSGIVTCQRMAQKHKEARDVVLEKSKDLSWGFQPVVKRKYRKALNRDAWLEECPKA